MSLVQGGLLNRGLGLSFSSDMWENAVKYSTVTVRPPEASINRVSARRRPVLVISAREEIALKHKTTNSEKLTFSIQTLS